VKKTIVSVLFIYFDVLELRERNVNIHTNI